MFNRDRVFRLERVCGEKERGLPLGHRVGERVESRRGTAVPVRPVGRYVIFSLALPFTSFPLSPADTTPRAASL